MIPKIDLEKILSRDPQELEKLRQGVEVHGFLIVHNTGITVDEMNRLIRAYRAFFQLPLAEKSWVDMAKTGSNRGWGGSGSEQVDPTANPDYKEVFDAGFELPADDPMGGYSVHAANLWPTNPKDFQEIVQDYYRRSQSVALDILRAIAAVMNLDQNYFDDKFSKPMALLRGNYYPKRPKWAGEKDFGIAKHTDYGCVTLLGTDGVPGLEAQTIAGDWIDVVASPGEFIINFGEMLQMWTDGAVRATPHRVRGSQEERISIPLFFNPNYDTNVAPLGSGQTIVAGEHLSKRFQETYLHLKR